MTDHVEYLKKAVAAEKHLKEYANKMTGIYFVIMLVFGFGAMFSGNYPIIITFTLFALSTMSGIMGLIEEIRAEKTFEKEFKEEADIIAEYEKLLKDE